MRLWSCLSSAFLAAAAAASEPNTYAFGDYNCVDRASGEPCKATRDADLVVMANASVHGTTDEEIVLAMKTAGVLEAPERFAIGAGRAIDACAACLATIELALEGGPGANATGAFFGAGRRALPREGAVMAKANVHPSDQTQYCGRVWALEGYALEKHCVRPEDGFCTCYRGADLAIGFDPSCRDDELWLWIGVAIGSLAALACVAAVCRRYVTLRLQ